MNLIHEPEFSYPLPVEKVSAAGITRVIEAKESERRNLAKRFELLDLSKLRAELTIKSVRGGQAIEVKGHLTADVIQSCGVTNEPVPDHIESDIEVLFTTGTVEEGAEAFVDPTEVEIEPVINGVIDLGELVAQNLGIALNPYPRKPGAVFEAVVIDDNKPVASVSPLAKLAELAKKSKDQPKE